MVTTGKLHRKLPEFHADKVGNVHRFKGQQSAQSGHSLPLYQASFGLDDAV